MLKNKNTILVISGVVLAIGAAYLLTRKKDEGDIPSIPLEANTSPSIKKENVIIPQGGISLFSEDGKRITRKTSSKNEVVGPFLNYKTLNGKVYVVFNDRFNNGLRSIALKSLTNYKNK